MESDALSGAPSQPRYLNHLCGNFLPACGPFQLAIYAEFRQDWRGAVAELQTAYSYVRAVSAGPGAANLPVQRFFEVAKVRRVFLCMRSCVSVRWLELHVI